MWKETAADPHPGRQKFALYKIRNRAETSAAGYHTSSHVARALAWCCQVWRFPEANQRQVDQVCSLA